MLTVIEVNHPFLKRNIYSRASNEYWSELKNFKFVYKAIRKPNILDFVLSYVSRTWTAGSDNDSRVL